MRTLQDAVRALVSEWRSRADDPNSTVEALYGDVISECADELETLLGDEPDAAVGVPKTSPDNDPLLYLNQEELA